eukprot:scaffold50552_cov61-Phaeocystis_antarctica.AAC.3
MASHALSWDVWAWHAAHPLRAQPVQPAGALDEARDQGARRQGPGGRAHQAHGRGHRRQATVHGRRLTRHTAGR